MKIYLVYSPQQNIEQVTTYIDLNKAKEAERVLKANLNMAGHQNAITKIITKEILK